MSACPRCHTINRPGARFCGHCGATIASGIPCPACGAMNRPTAHFCGGCRTALRVQCPQCGRDNRPSARFCGGCRATLTSPVSPPARFGTGQIQPQTIVHGRYRVLGLIAQGGMGAVYQAADTRLQGKLWALKEMSEKGLSPDERQTAIEQFQQEALMLATLHHRNLPQVVDVFEERGKHYLVMEYIEGQTLEEILQAAGGPLPEPRVLAWAEQLCDVLGYLHAQNPPIIYRDLKPTNVMEENQTGVVKLIDFGIARFHKTGKTRDTTLLGTPGYAPPEQYGKGQSDARSDVYALGVMLHQLLTGYDPSQNPFHLPPACMLNPDVSEHVEKAIAKATQLAMADRYQSASAFWKALAPPVPAPPKPKPAKPKKAPPKNPKLDVGIGQIDFGDVIWGGTATQTIRAKNTGGQVLQGKAETDAAWLHVTPEKFSRNDEKLTVSVETAGLTLRRLHRPAPNILRASWDKINQIGLVTAGIIVTVLFFLGLIWIPVTIAVLTLGAQGIIWLAYWHARHIIPDATHLQGIVELQTNGGDKIVDVEVTVLPRKLERAIGWSAIVVFVIVELAVAAALISEIFS